MNYSSCELTINGQAIAVENVKVELVAGPHVVGLPKLTTELVLEPFEAPKWLMNKLFRSKAIRLKRRRGFKAVAKRVRRRIRRGLVHEAGCGRCLMCLDRWLFQELVHDAVALGVRIPRSLRHLR